jgi:hypothetical protein
MALRWSRYVTNMSEGKCVFVSKTHEPRSDADLLEFLINKSRYDEDAYVIHLSFNLLYFLVQDAGISISFSLLRPFEVFLDTAICPLQGLHLHRTTQKMWHSLSFQIHYYQVSYRSTLYRP